MLRRLPLTSSEIVSIEAAQAMGLSPGMSVAAGHP
jgi:hypothetical protein